MNTQYNGLPANAVAVVQQASAGNASNVCVMPAIPGRINVLQKVSISAGGATVAALVEVTSVGLEVPLALAVPVVAGVLLGVDKQDTFVNGLKATAPNTAVSVTLPAFGLGNTKATLRIEGYHIPG